MKTLVTRIASPVWIAGIAIVLASSPAASAQTAEQPQPVRFDVNAEGFASIQRGTGSELIHGLADQMDRSMLGLSVAGTVGADNGFVVSIEGSTTRQVTASAGGRAVGPAVLTASHQLTTISVLPGFRKLHRAGMFEAGIGIGMQFGSWTFLREVPDVARPFLVAATIRNGFRLSERVSLTVSLSYLRLFPGARGPDYGLATHVFRPGTGVRVRL